MINTNLHNFLIKCCAVRVTSDGNSKASIPLNIILYVFIGSGHVKGGLKREKKYHYNTDQSEKFLSHGLVLTVYGHDNFVL